MMSEKHYNKTIVAHENAKKDSLRKLTEAQQKLQELKAEKDFFLDVINREAKSEAVRQVFNDSYDGAIREIETIIANLQCSIRSHEESIDTNRELRHKKKIQSIAFKIACAELSTVYLRKLFDVACKDHQLSQDDVDAVQQRIADLVKHLAAQI